MIDRWDAGLFDGIPRSVKILGRAVFEILVCASQRLPRCEARQPGLRLFTLTRLCLRLKFETINLQTGANLRPIDAKRGSDDQRVSRRNFAD
jgi:hypothetical protein